MMLRADWLLAADLCSILQADSHRAGLSAQSALLPVLPDTATCCRSSSHTHTYTHSWVRTTGCCNLQTSPERAKNRNTTQCVHIALCDTAGYYYFCALLGGNGGGVSLHVIIMDCFFLLIWTLPIPLVGCTSVKLLSTLLSWNIIKACGN